MGELTKGSKFSTKGRMWYYSQNNQQLGPISEDQLKAMLRGGVLGGATLVWKEGMSDWTAVADVAVLASVAPQPMQIAPAPQPAANPYATPQRVAVTTHSPYHAAPPINSGGILAFAICVTVLCCIPFGVVGIVFAAQINQKLAMGDYAGAADSARKAKMWSWIGLGSWLVLIGFYALAVVGGAASGTFK